MSTPVTTAHLATLADLDLPVRLAVAGLIGLAIGVEREWSGHASGPNARFAGVRTFLLLGLVGGPSKVGTFCSEQVGTSR